ARRAIRRPPPAPLFPYTPLFRSRASGSGGVAGLSRQSGAGADGHLSGDFGGLSGYGCFERGVTPFLGLPAVLPLPLRIPGIAEADRKSTRLNSSHVKISYAVFCL